MKDFIVFFILIHLSSAALFAQDATDSRIIFPEKSDWNEVKEGDTLQMQLQISGDTPEEYKFDIEQGALGGMVLEDDGEFFWTPHEALVDSAQESSNFPVVIAAKNNRGNKIRQKIDFKVINKTKPTTEAGSQKQPVAAGQAAKSDDKPQITPADTTDIELILPEQEDWNVIEEDDTLAVKMNADGGADQNYRFRMVKGNHLDGLTFDSLGNFRWHPGYDFVDRLEKEKTVQVQFEVRNDYGQVARERVDLTVNHVNRPPEISDLKTFYVEYNTTNTYQIESYAVNDKDGDPIIFKPIINGMPEGAKLTENGKFTWNPSITQFNQLKQNPIELEFIAEDQPYNAQTKGSFMIKATSRDLPPEISMIPNDKKITIKEDETLNLKFYLSDPNGDDNITNFSFIAEEGGIPEDALIKNSNTQYEFVWEPGYEFVKQHGDTLNFDLKFFVLDQSNKRDEKTVNISVVHAENLPRIDTLRYNQYQQAVVRAWNLLKQLEEKEAELKKKYRKVKKGKRYRAITDASLGAVTGIGPVLIDDQEASKYVTGIGGTASATLGTLEATDMIGTPPSEVQEKLSKVIQKKQTLQNQGDIFASDYSLKSNRRDDDFKEDLQSFLSLMKLDDLASLELDAGWENPEEPSYENIAKTFENYSPKQN